MSRIIEILKDFADVAYQHRRQQKVRMDQELRRWRHAACKRSLRGVDRKLRLARPHLVGGFVFVRLWCVQCQKDREVPEGITTCPVHRTELRRVA